MKIFYEIFIFRYYNEGDIIMITLRKCVISTIVIAFHAFGLLFGCAKSQKALPISETRLMLGTFCAITLYNEKDMRLLDEAFELCAQYEALLSMTIRDSDVWRINNASGQQTEVSDLTAFVIREGLRYSELSGGMFDISIGKLSSLWDFTGSSGVPTSSEIAAARAGVGYQRVTITDNLVTLSDPETWIDLGAIAKGFIADAVASFLKDNGVGAAVIDFGGNIVTVGQKPDGGVWRVGIAKPFSDRNETVGITETNEASIVSSGTYERYFIQDGELYHHVLNPFTGKPSGSGVVSATVVSESSMQGDALSTIILLLGSECVNDLLLEMPEIMGVVLVLENDEVLVFGDIEFTLT